jgi:hypothetical protein
LISGAIHTVSPNLMQSQLDYRSHIEAQRTQGEQMAPEAIKPETPQPSDVRDPEQAGSQLTLNELEIASQEHHDQTRKIAVLKFVIQNTQKMDDTYVNASSNSDNNDDMNTQTIDPAEAYKASKPDASQLSNMHHSEQKGSQLNLDELEITSQEQRNKARKVGVQTFDVQNTQNMVDTHVNATSGSDNDDDMNTQTIDPSLVYKARMKYVRRFYLLSALKKAAQGESSGSKLNVII